MVRLNETTGLIQSISLDGGKLDVEQEILWYAAREPQLKNYTKSAMRRGSGLYIFRPNQTSPFPARKQGGVSILIYKGYHSISSILLVYVSLFLMIFRKTCSRNSPTVQRLGWSSNSTLQGTGSRRIGLGSWSN